MRHNYEVIRVIRQGSNSCIGSDYVLGETLGGYLLRHPRVEKEQLFSWISQIIKQLADMEDIEAIDQDKHITPFHIMIQTDKTVGLLKSKVKIPQEFQKKFDSKEAVRKDIYSFGKTLQFLFAKSSLPKGLTRGEESRLQKIIVKCLTDNSRKQYHHFGQVVSDFSAISSKKRRQLTRGIVIIACVGFGLWGAYTWLSDIILQNGKAEGSFEEESDAEGLDAKELTNKSENGEESVQRERQAYQYLKEEKYLEALEIYIDLLESRQEEAYYRTVVSLYEKCNMPKEALGVCEEGLEKYAKSTELALSFIQLVCKNETFTKEEKEEKISEVVRKRNAVLETKRFSMLQREYGIRVEGEQVWFER